MLSEERIMEIAEDHPIWYAIPQGREKALLIKFARAIEREAYKAGQESMRERAALEAEKEFTYPAGYQGQWEGYGAIRTVRHGKESAAAIRNLEIEEPK